jgi:hypothetical protein
VTYTEETANCNGLDSTVISGHSCSVLISDLITAPYHLTWGSSIYAKVTAINIINNSLESLEGNGAIILTIPDAPTDLANVPAVTTSSQIGLIWNEGSANGGSPIIDYTVSYGIDTGSYTMTETSITDTSYTVLGLTVGVTYKFKVQARNEYGLSDYSSEVLILVAQLPDTPVAPTTEVVAANVLIEWTPPSSQGSAI